MHPSDDDLAALALAEPVEPEMAVHVEHCPRCFAEVAELRATMALVGEPPVDLVEPPASVWDAVADAVATPSAPALRVVPDAGVPSRWRGRAAWLAGSVAAGVLIGLAAGQLAPWSTLGERVVSTAALRTLDDQRVLGAAELVRRGDVVEVRLKTTAVESAPGYVEVWLINRDLTRMVSIGVLPEGATQRSFPVSQTLIDEGFVIVDVSREAFDADPRHSGDSVVRGALTS